MEIVEVKESISHRKIKENVVQSVIKRKLLMNLVGVCGATNVICGQQCMIHLKKPMMLSLRWISQNGKK